MDEALAMEIESLRKLKTKALHGGYRELFGEESRSSNHAYLFRRIAWRLQAKAQGDLSERARKRAAEVADDAHLRLRAPLWGPSKTYTNLIDFANGRLSASEIRSEIASVLRSTEALVTVVLRAQDLRR